jgi:DNA-binding MarR family transcriptional regulator
MTIDVVNNNIGGRARAGTRQAGGFQVADQRLVRANGASGGPSAAAGRPRKNGRAALSLGVLNRHVGYFARRFQVWIFQDFIRRLGSLKIRPAQYSVLAVIEENPGLSQADMATLLGIERARLVRLLDNLEERHLLRRRPSRHDRRSHALTLTAAGRRRLKQSKDAAAQHEVDLAERLGADRHKALLEILKDFSETLEPRR